MLAADRAFVGHCGELLEVLAVVSVIGIVVALSGASYRLAGEHVRIVEALDLASGARINLHEHLAVNGAWPAEGHIELSGVASELQDEFPWRYVASLDAGSDGALHFSMQESATGGPGYRLSLRAAVKPEQAGSAIVWVCGYADPPAGFATLAGNETNIDESRLPAPCRSPTAPRRRLIP